MSLKRAVLEGSSWTFLSVGMGQIIRLVKSLVLTRMLFPDAYGVMAIVWSTLYALNMLSDAGLSAAAIRHERANDPKFMNTLWTMKIMRGVAILCVTCVVAYPMSVIYRMPDLTWLLPIAGFTTIISGMNSTNIYSQQRQMAYRRLTILELSNEVLGLVVILIWAYFYPGVGAMIGAACVTAVYFLAASHYLLPGDRNRFAWDPSSVKDLFDFGKWIFFSSVLYLIYTQGDRLLLGHYLDAKTLGVYSIAIMVSEIVSGVIGKVNNTVLFPALNSVIQQDRSRLRHTYYKTRIGLDMVALAPIGALMILGNELVSIMYDHRYQDAGWILQVLCARLCMVAMLSTGDMCLLALGKPKYAVVQNVGRAIWVLVGIPLVWPAFGLVGTVWVIATTEIPSLVVLWYGMNKHNLLSIWCEARSLAAVAVGVLTGFSLQRLLF